METEKLKGLGRGRGRGRVPGESAKDPTKPQRSLEVRAAVEKHMVEVRERFANLFVIDGGESSASAGTSGATGTADADTSKNNVPGKDKLPLGFLFPKEVNISNKGDDIQEGEVFPVVASAIFSPSLIYLVFEAEYFEEMEDFIDSMSSKYIRAFGFDDCRHELTAHPEHMEIGSMFAVSTIKETTKEPEWLRCKLIEKGPAGNKFRSLDLGLDVEPGDKPVAYLHETCCTKPSWAIKCRLHLSPNFDKFHFGVKPWSKEVTKKLCRSLFEQAMMARFVRKFKEDGETMWEVSLLGFAVPVDGFDPEKPIEIQIMERTKDFHKEKVERVDFE